MYTIQYNITYKGVNMYLTLDTPGIYIDVCNVFRYPLMPVARVPVCESYR